MESFSLLINGRMVAGAQTMPVINPATEEVLVQCPRASKAQLDEAVAAAKAAFPAWAATPIGDRRALIVRMAETIEKNAGDLARILTQEQGKPTADATGEVMGMAGFFRYFASLDLPMRVIEDAPAARSRRTAARSASSAPSSRGTFHCSSWRSSCRPPCWPATPWW